MKTFACLRRFCLLQLSYNKYPDLDRSYRFVWVLTTKGKDIPAVADIPQIVSLPAQIMVVAGPDSRSKTTFLQVAAWDLKHKWFNYYERLNGEQILYVQQGWYTIRYWG